MSVNFTKMEFHIHITEFTEQCQMELQKLTIHQYFINYKNSHQISDQSPDI